MPSALRRILWLCPVLCLVASGHAQTAFSSVVVFGDSLSDTGNIAHLVQNANPLGIRYPADNQLLGFDYTNGRFTDGADTQPPAEAYFGVWIEQLAASFPAKPAVTDSLDGGSNYAYGDATTGMGTTTISETVDLVPVSITLHNMGQQVSDYLANVASNSASAPNAQTLFVLWGGADDIYGGLAANVNPVTEAATAVQNELALVTQLIGAGATNFMIPNLPPLGGVPEYATNSNAAALNEAAAVFAQGLAQGIATIQMTAAAQGIPVNIYSPDIFTLFTTDAANPMAVGLGNVTAAAQNISGDPDIYLIWDGLHPTTTGHHYAAAAAANLLTPLVASTTTLSAPAVVLSNQPATVTIAVTSTASSGVPTGLVTLFANSGEIAAGALNSSGVGTVTVPASTVVPGTYTITAVYAGDTVFNVSASGGQPGTVLAASVGTTTTLSSSNTSPGTGASVTFTATVAPAASSYGQPTGTVTFLNGTSSLGTGTLSNGTATFTTTALPAGTLSVTASYPATGIFGASTSTAVTETVVAPTFTPVASPTSLSIADGSSGTTMLSATSANGYSGALTLACGTLPARLSCSFSATTYTLQGLTGALQAPVTLTIATNASAAMLLQARPGSWSAPEVLSATLLLPGCASLLLTGIKRRRLPGGALGLSVLVALMSAAAVGLDGCGSSSSGSNAAPGTYTIPVTFTPGTGTAQTVNLSVTVQ